MRLVIISDTHCNQFPLPDGDILIHCGDHTYQGHKHESWEALNWLSTSGNFKHRLCIAGNHELGWEADFDSNRFRQIPITKPKVFDDFPNLTYLHNSGVTIGDTLFWGSPVQPEFHGWAFQKPRGPALRAHWELIPEDVGVLITHGPPYGFGDTNKYDQRFGDEDLLQAVYRVKPDIHCFGHAHAGYGTWFHQGIQFVNAAILNEEYKVQNPPWEIDYDETTVS